MHLLFWIILGLLTLLSAALAWFALQKFAPLVVLPPADRRGFLVVAAQYGMRARLNGAPATWRLQGQVAGRPTQVRVIEVDGQRWTEARLLVGQGPAVESGWLTRAVQGVDGDALAALLEQLAATVS